MTPGLEYSEMCQLFLLTPQDLEENCLKTSITTEHGSVVTEGGAGGGGGCTGTGGNSLKR